MEGFATMHMRMPMSTSSLPILGECNVTERRVALKFPFTGIEFDLPREPKEDQNEFDFKIRANCGDMTMNIGYIKELKCYTGVGRQEENDTPIITFYFYESSSPMTKLPRA